MHKYYNSKAYIYIIMVNKTSKSSRNEVVCRYILVYILYYVDMMYVALIDTVSK